jgi:rfaE bifunctional protein nucleotidyltransferase chain/domain
VTTNGCFDILHVGHIQSLTAAKALGDVLVVGINSDASVRALKGKNRPVVPERERAEIIASLKPVDAVFVFGEADPRKWLAVLKPDVHAKGSDRTMEEIIEKDVVERGGGKIVRLSLKKGRSTTNIIEKIKKDR